MAKLATLQGYITSDDLKHIKSYSINELARLLHDQSKEAGWWDNVDVDEVFPVKLCLIHSEISEAMEGHRKKLMDTHLPHRPMAEVELADAMIRIMDLAAASGYDLEGAILEKAEYNKNRADHKKENRQKENGKKY